MEAEVRALIESAQANLEFLPPYSPDFNPVKKMWSKVKASLGEAKARRREELFEAIKQALYKVNLQDAEGWFLSCGYAAFQH